MLLKANIIPYIDESYNAFDQFLKFLQGIEVKILRKKIKIKNKS